SSRCQRKQFMTLAMLEHLMSSGALDVLLFASVLHLKSCAESTIHKMSAGEIGE
ncbi:hypothetical protein Bpfe_007099, partial [Biomphalaria pfeifferi]